MSDALYSFAYHDSEVNCKNYISDEMKQHALMWIRCFHGLTKHFKSFSVPRKTTIMLYKMLEKSMLTYASVTWQLSRSDERLLSSTEGVISSIFLHQ
jgi:hypothetical protein